MARHQFIQGALDLIESIVHTQPDMTGTADEWRFILEVLEDGEYLASYFGGEDTEENKEIVELAYDLVSNQIDIVK